MRRIIYHPAPHRIRHQRGEMNATERAYAEHLLALKYSGEIIDFRFEAVAFTLAHNEPGRRNSCTYTPDFQVIVPVGDGIEIWCIDTKALWTKNEGGKKKQIPGYKEDSRIKIKLAAELFPEFRWFGVWRDESGQWVKEEF